MERTQGALIFTVEVCWEAHATGDVGATRVFTSKVIATCQTMLFSPGLPRRLQTRLHDPLMYEVLAKDPFRIYVRLAELLVLAWEQ